MKALAGVLIGLVALAAVVAMVGIGCSNKEVRLRNRITAQQKKNESDFDKVWKVIQQQAGVTEQYKDSFRSIYVEIMDARYSGNRGDALMKWVHESNPTFDNSLFTKLMTTIEAQREGFARNQALLLDLKREHDDCLQTFPSSLFVGGRQPIEVVIVTSGKTKESFATGEENDVNLFKHDTAPVKTSTR